MQLFEKFQMGPGFHSSNFCVELCGGNEVQIRYVPDDAETLDPALIDEFGSDDFDEPFPRVSVRSQSKSEPLQKL